MIPTNPPDDPYNLLAEEPQIVKAIRGLIQRNNTSKGSSAGEDGSDSRNLNNDLRDLSFNAQLSSNGNTLTLTPIKSGVMPLLGDDGDGWSDFILESAITLSTAGYTSDKLYDIFYFYDQSQDTPILTLYTLIWASETARTTDLTTVDGVSLLSTDTHYRYLATGRYNGSTMLVPTIDPNGELFFGTGNPRDNVSNPFSGVGMSAAGVQFGSYVWQFFAVVGGVVGVGFNALGQLLAGAGAVILDHLGISLVIGTSYSSPASIKFTNSGVTESEIYGYDTGTQQSLIVKAGDVSVSENSFLSMNSNAKSGKTASTLLGAIGGSGNAKIAMSASGTVGTPTPNSIDIGATGVTGIKTITTINSGNGQIAKFDGDTNVIVFNEDGLIVDTRIESDTDANAIFVKGSTGNVGIGNNAPTEKLDVTGNIKASGTVAAAGNVTGANLSGTNTGDQTAASLGVIPNSGWTEVPDSWAYASASTITVPTDATTAYQKGDYLRLKQGGGYKYFVIASLTATVVTVLVNTDYTVANSAITDIAYSRGVNPFGWPGRFNFAPAVTSTGGTITTSTVNSAYYHPAGNKMSVDYDVTISNIGTGTGTAIFATPITAALRTVVHGIENAVTGKSIKAVLAASGTTFSITDYTNTNMLTNNYRYNMHVEMEF